jgi:hypothetical protein
MNEKIKTILELVDQIPERHKDKAFDLMLYDALLKERLPMLRKGVKD